MSSHLADFLAFPTSKKLTGQVAIVTGADSGIGQAIAVEFAKEGANVAITYYHDKDGINETKAAIESHGQKALVYQLDQKHRDSVGQLFQQVDQVFGLPTILVNNAAVNMSGKSFNELTVEDWETCIQTNLNGPFYCCKEFIKRLADNSYQRHGSIINITSVHEEIPHLGGSEYGAAKGGLQNLTRTLALEFGNKNININNLAPGMILTPMNQEALDNPDILQHEIKPIPMKRAGLPVEIARAAVFLASEDARYVQGTTLTVDGGLSLYHGQEPYQENQRSQRFTASDISVFPKTAAINSLAL